jgi:hypothetical protein
MAKSETFQDLSLMPPGENQELGRWLYTELRAAILNGRLKPPHLRRRGYYGPALAGFTTGRARRV